MYAETEPAAQSGATLTTENPSQAEQPKQGWQDDGTYYRDGVMLTGLQIIDGKLYDFGSNGVGAIYTGNYNNAYYVGGTLANGTYNKLLYCLLYTSRCV